MSGKMRAASVERLKDEFDILIIGGGITGAGIARDAAMRGFRTALVEKGDLASGTSSKSSKLVHGGVRYLELFEFGLVFEASRERRTLATIAPDLVRPLPFLFPVYRDARWPAWMINTGLWMYDGLSLFRNFGRHHMYSNARIAQLMPGIDTRNINGGALYYDGQVDDARLTLETARAAQRHGAVVLNYYQVDELIKDQQTGRVAGARVHDTLSGAQCTVRSRIVVNATGPWTDQIIHLDDPGTPNRLRPTKGIHILVPRSKLGSESAVAFPAASDGRLMFVIPWDNMTLVGTTDTDYEGDYDRVHADRADVDYVIAAVNHAFPESPISLQDIISTFAGLRPLVLQTGKSASGTSREHEIWTTDAGLLTIAGGKLTTYRSMAAQLVDIAAKQLKEEFGIQPAHPAATAREPLIEGDGASPKSGLSEQVIAHLVHTHGPQYTHVAERVAADPQLGERLAEGLPYIWAEVDVAVEEEMALTLGDVLGRRTHVLNEAADNGKGVAERVAERMAKLLGWSKEQADRQLGEYTRDVERVTAFRNV